MKRGTTVIGKSEMATVPGRPAAGQLDATALRWPLGDMCWQRSSWRSDPAEVRLDACL
ncbi:hypothetical protein FAGKG844_320026 [Frankia sp. AgKG'84/4]